MAKPGGARRQPRTLLEQLIRERQQTFEEFAEYAETFARAHGESGTLSLRHLQRLVGGHQQIDTLRPATIRLLESIFGLGVGKLLASPAAESEILTAALASKKAYPLRVAVAVVVNNSDVLIVCRRDEYSVGLTWQFPAGMVKPGVPPEVVAVRETLAETGVHCAVQRKLGTRLHPITNVLCEYVLCKYLTGDAHNADVAENVDVSWVNKRKLIDIVPAEQIFPPILVALQIMSAD